MNQRKSIDQQNFNESPKINKSTKFQLKINGESMKINEDQQVIETSIKSTENQ